MAEEDVIDLVSDIDYDHDNEERADLDAIFGDEDGNGNDDDSDDDDNASNRITGNKRSRNENENEDAFGSASSGNSSSSAAAAADSDENDKCPICSFRVKPFSSVPSMRFGCCNNIFHFECALACIGGRFHGCPTCGSDYHSQIKRAFIDKDTQLEEARREAASSQFRFQETRREANVAQARYQEACNVITDREETIGNLHNNLRQQRDANERLQYDNRRLLADLERSREACRTEETRRLASERLTHKLHETSCRTVDALQSDLKLAVRCLDRVNNNARVADETTQRFFHNASIMKPRLNFWSTACVKSLYGKYVVEDGALPVPCENTVDTDINVAVEDSDSDSDSDNDFEEDE
jgi:hypothetical protein